MFQEFLALRDVSLTIRTCDQLVAIFNGEYDREMEYTVK